MAFMVASISPLVIKPAGLIGTYYLLKPIKVIYFVGVVSVVPCKRLAWGFCYPLLSLT